MMSTKTEYVFLSLPDAVLLLLIGVYLGHTWPKLLEGSVASTSVMLHVVITAVVLGHVVFMMSTRRLKIRKIYLSEDEE